MSCDVTSQEQRGKLLKFIDEKYGKLDVLVANAGVQLITGRQLVAKEQAYDKTFEVNVKSVFFLVKDSVALLKKGGKKSNIFVTSSMSGK